MGGTKHHYHTFKECNDNARAVAFSSALLLVAGWFTACFCQFDGTGFDGIAVYFGQGDGTGSETIGDSATVYKMNLRTSVITKLYGSKEAVSGTWWEAWQQQGAYLTADGKRIVFAHGANLSIMNNDGTSVRDILTHWDRESWCLAANGVFYMTKPYDPSRNNPTITFHMYHVDIETGVVSLVYTFNPPICQYSWGTDICSSLNGLRIHTRADIVVDGNSACVHGDNAYLTLNPNLTVDTLVHAYMWGHGSAVARDGRYAFHNRWEDVPGYPSGWHKHFWVVDFDNPMHVIRDVLIKVPALSFAQRHQAMCLNDDNYLGVDINADGDNSVDTNTRSVIIERGDDRWSTTTQYEIPSGPPFARIGNFWKGSTLPTPDVTPVLYINQSNLVFSILSGTQIFPESLTVANGGGGALETIQAAIAHSAAWLNLSLSGEGNNQIIAGTVNVGSLADGVYHDTIVITCGNTPNTLRCPVTLNLHVLPQPMLLEAQTTGDSLFDVHMTWTDYATTENGFAIERSSNSGTTWTEIARTAANATNYFDIHPPRGDEWYRVRAFMGTTYSAYSNVATVLVTGFPWITVTAPASAEVWERGSSHTICWSANLIDHVTISYSLNDGVNWIYAMTTGESVSRGEANWGAYQWTVPDTVCSHALIKIEDYGGCSISGISGSFCIVPHPGTVARSPAMDEKHLFCDRGELVVRAGVEPMTIRLYSLSGQLVAQRSLAAGQSAKIPADSSRLGANMIIVVLEVQEQRRAVVKRIVSR